MNLFLCAHNSARSQMAEGLLLHPYEENRAFRPNLRLCGHPLRQRCSWILAGLSWRETLPSSKGGPVKFRKVRDALRAWIEQTFVKGGIHA